MLEIIPPLLLVALGIFCVSGASKKLTKKHIDIISLCLTIITILFGIMLCGTGSNILITVLVVFYMILWAYICKTIGDKKQNTEYGYFWRIFSWNYRVNSGICIAR